MNEWFAVFGEDIRLRFAAEYLVQHGLRQLPPDGDTARADYLVFGMPMPSFESYINVLQTAKNGVLAFAGKVSHPAKLLAAQYDVPVIDYLESEELALLNAVPTAEGAIGTLLGATTGTLWRSRVVITGYGRLAQALVPRLQALGCRITIVARAAPARTLAEALGCESAPFSALGALAAKADFIINTVPACVITKEILAAAPKSIYIMDLASAPGGVDMEAARELSLRAQAAHGLPGKWAPAAAGAYIGQAICHFLETRGAFDNE